MLLLARASVALLAATALSFAAGAVLDTEHSVYLGIGIFCALVALSVHSEDQG